MCLTAPIRVNQFYDFLQQLLALPVDQQMAFFRSAQPEAPKNPTATAQSAADVENVLVVIPLTPVSTDTLQTITSSLPTRLQATNGVIGRIPLTPPAPPPTPASPFLPGSLRHMSFTLPRLLLVRYYRTTIVTPATLHCRVQRKIGLTYLRNRGAIYLRQFNH